MGRSTALWDEEKLVGGNKSVNRESSTRRISGFVTMGEHSMNCSRRDLAFMLPAINAFASAAEAPAHLPSEVYVFENLPVRHSGKLDFRQIVSGKTVDGCMVSVHESVLAPGSEPHPPHHHNGEEMFLVLQGTLEVTINGKSSRISRGSVAFIGSGDEHGIRNPGTVPAKYYVIELGPQR